MKHLTFILAVAFLNSTCFAQVDSAKTSSVDTIKIGGMVIIKKDDPNERHSRTITMGRGSHNNSNISTSEWVFDLGFANWIDKTDYAAATAGSYLVNRPGSSP